MWRPRLTDAELMLGAVVGAERNVVALTRDFQRGEGAGDDFSSSWSWNIDGAQAELAVAKALDLPFTVWRVAGRHNGDVGPYEVRCNASRKYTDTALHKTDRDDRVFISVLSFAPEFEIIGWIWGHDGKRMEYWRSGERPCFFVPITKLRPMAELPTPADLARLNDGPAF